MKRTMISVLMLGMVAVTSCGGSGSSPAALCVSPANVCAMAYATALNSMISNYVALSFGFSVAYVDGGNTGTFPNSTSTYSALAGVRGNPENTLTLTGGQWIQTKGSTFSIPAEHKLEYTSVMAEYPFTTGVLLGATITVGGDDYTVTATTPGTFSGDMYGEVTYTGSSLMDIVLTDMSVYSGHVTINPMTLTVTDPTSNETNGTASVSNQVIGATNESGIVRMSTVMTVTVTADSTNYNCTVAALYDPPVGSDYGDTGVGNLTISVSSCTEQ